MGSTVPFALSIAASRSSCGRRWLAGVPLLSGRTGNRQPAAWRCSTCGGDQEPIAAFPTCPWRRTGGYGRRRGCRRRHHPGAASRGSCPARPRRRSGSPWSPRGSRRRWHPRVGKSERPRIRAKHIAIALAGDPSRGIEVDACNDEHGLVGHHEGFVRAVGNDRRSTRYLTALHPVLSPDVERVTMSLASRGARVPAAAGAGSSRSAASNA